MGKLYAGWNGDSCMTYSWEFESQNLGILDAYHPRSVPFDIWKTLSQAQREAYHEWAKYGVLKDEAVVRAIATRVAAIEEQQKKKFEPGIDHKRFLVNRRLDYEMYDKNETFLDGTGEPVPACYPSHLHQEVSPQIWEMAHSSYEEDLDAMLAQLDDLKRRYASTNQKPNFHIHVVFPIPHRSNGAEADLVHKQLVGLTLLTSNHSYLNKVDSLQKGLDQYAGVLGVKTANRIEEFLQSGKTHDKIEKQISSGECVGLAKFTRVGFRYIPYNESGKTPERIGLEFRAGYKFETLKQLIKDVVKVLTLMGKDYGTGGAERAFQMYRSAMEKGIQMSRKSIPAEIEPFLTEIANCEIAVRETKRNLQLPYTHGQKPSERTKRILERWSFAFVDWSEHLLVPDCDKNGLKSLRTQLIAQIKQIKDKEGQAATKVGEVWRAIERWNQAANVKKYFTLNIAIENARPSLLPSTPTGADAPEPPPPPPVF